MARRLSVWLGIVYALASAGEAAGREDMIEMALAGAADVAGRNEAGPDGFLVPHSDPPHRPDVRPAGAIEHSH